MPTVFERAPEPLLAWARSRQRLLHPNLYAWPAPGWREERAGLPILDWTAATCDRVANTMRHAWYAHRRALRIAYEDQEVVDLDVESGAWKLRLGDGTEAAGFAACLLATGWAKERHLRDWDDGYWGDNRLDDDHAPGASWIVIGTGDGGSVDYLRLSLHRFEQWPKDGGDAERFLAALEDPALQREVDAAQTIGDAKARLDAYLALSPPLLDGFLREKLDKRGKADVVLADKTEHPLDEPGFALNRLLVARVLALRGMVDASTPTPLYRTVTVDARGRVRPSPPETVVMRIGPGLPFTPRILASLRRIAGGTLTRPKMDTPDPSAEVAWCADLPAAEGSAQGATLLALAEPVPGSYALASALLALCGAGFDGGPDERRRIDAARTSARGHLSRIAARDVPASAIGDWMRALWRQFREGDAAAREIALGWAWALDEAFGRRFVDSWRVAHGLGPVLLSQGGGIPSAVPLVAEDLDQLKHLRVLHAPPELRAWSAWTRHLDRLPPPDPAVHLEFWISPQGTAARTGGRARGDAGLVRQVLARLGVPLL